MPAEILLQKYEYHVPFYRQVKEYRHLGVRLTESTLSGWFKPVCELLSPLYSELVKLVTGSGYVQVDETTVRVINKGKGKNDKEYLWMVRAVMEKPVIFHYDDSSRSGQTIRNLLKDFKGYLQSDGYNAYNAFEGTKDVCLIVCLAHIRRHMELALDENRSLAEYALKQIQELYHIEQMPGNSMLGDDVSSVSVWQHPYLTPLKNRWNRLTAKHHQEVVWDKLLPILILFGQE